MAGGPPTRNGPRQRLREIADPAVVRAMAHPLRMRIAATLDQRVASPRQLAEELNAPIGTVSYHVRRLVDFGLARQVGEQRRRGAIEHFYEATSRWVVPDTAWEQLPGLVQRAVTREILSQIASDLALARFDSRHDHLSRARLSLDDQARNELGKLCSALLRRAHELAEETQRRRSRTSSTTEVEAVLMAFRVDESARQPQDHPRPETPASRQMPQQVRRRRTRP